MGRGGDAPQLLSGRRRRAGALSHTLQALRSEECSDETLLDALRLCATATPDLRRRLQPLLCERLVQRLVPGNGSAGEKAAIVSELRDGGALAELLETANSTTGLEQLLNRASETLYPALLRLEGDAFGARCKGLAFNWLRRQLLDVPDGQRSAALPAMISTLPELSQDAPGHFYATSSLLQELTDRKRADLWGRTVTGAEHTLDSLRAEMRADFGNSLDNTISPSVFESVPTPESQLPKHLKKTVELIEKAPDPRDAAAREMQRAIAAACLDANRKQLLTALSESHGGLDAVARTFLWQGRGVPHEEIDDLCAVAIDRPDLFEKPFSVYLSASLTSHEEADDPSGAGLLRMRQMGTSLYQVLKAEQGERQTT